MHKMIKRVLGGLLAFMLLLSASAVAAAKDTEVDGAALTGAAEETEVPQIRVTTEDGNGVRLLKSDGYVDAFIEITDTDGTKLSGDVQFKVRGNTTAFDSIPKKAFAFKFSKKQSIFGMGKGKKWVLLANCYDPSLLRNYLAIDMAQELGLEYTSNQRFVELWLDGSYRGCYTLYEPVQEGKDRVDIDIDSNDGKKDFLIEYEQMADEDDKAYFTVDGWRFAVKEPDDTTDEQTEYIEEVMTGIVEKLKSGKREDAESVIDIPSFAKFYLVNEFMKNMDFDMSSVYYYYKDGLLYAGPVWDFDKSSGNTNPDVASKRVHDSYITDGIMQNRRTLYSYFGATDWFTEEVRALYDEHFDYMENIAADGGLLDSLRETYRAVFDRNFTVYNIRTRWTTMLNLPEATYEENYQYFKNWCGARHAWLKDHWELTTYTYLRGDADGDGEVTILDATLVQRVDASILEDSDGMITLRAAVTDDGLSITDATAIQRWMAEIVDDFGLNESVTVHRLPKANR